MTVPTPSTAQPVDFVNSIHINHDRISAFREKGFIKLDGLFTAECISALREEALRHLKAASDLNTNYGSEFKRLTYGLGETETLRDIYTATPFRKAVVELTGGPLIMTDAQAFELSKEKTGFEWHYDSLSFEPPRGFRRPFRLSHAAMAGSSSMA
jgi:hypothetical protein